jgi:hypothetical protein
MVLIISDFGLEISDCPWFFNPQSKIRNPKFLPNDYLSVYFNGTTFESEERIIIK